MNKSKWLDLIDMLEAKFGLLKNHEEPLGNEIPGYKHVIEFKGPTGKIKLEWTEKGRLQDVKTIYSNRVGSFTKVDKVYDEDDKVNFLEAFQWDEASNMWEKISVTNFMSF